MAVFDAFDAAERTEGNVIIAIVGLAVILHVGFLMSAMLAGVKEHIH